MIFRAEIETLKQERDELLKNLSVAESSRNRRIDNAHVNKIRQLLEENGKLQLKKWVSVHVLGK